MLFILPIPVPRYYSEVHFITELLFMVGLAIGKTCKTLLQLKTLIFHQLYQETH